MATTRVTSNAALHEDSSALRNEAIKAGAVAGITAGIIMALFAMIRSYMMGMGFWLPVKQIAALIFGVDAILGGFGVLLTGLVIHVLTSAVLGAVFGVLIGDRARSVSNSAVGGLLFGAVVWFVMSFLVLPWANPVMDARTELMPIEWFLYHLVFGLFLFTTPFYLRSIAPRSAYFASGRRAPAL